MAMPPRSYYIRRFIAMCITNEVKEALSVFRALTPENQDTLLDLAEELLRLQEVCDGSTAKEQ